MTTFPQYRKYANGTTYFKIVSEKEFIEVSFVGTRKFELVIQASQYPEFLRIMDMLACKDDIWEVVKEKEFDKL